MIGEEEKEKKKNKEEWEKEREVERENKWRKEEKEEDEGGGVAGSLVVRFTQNDDDYTRALKSVLSGDSYLNYNWGLIV